jgi:hypothetical protein
MRLKGATIINPPELYELRDLVASIADSASGGSKMISGWAGQLLAQIAERE